MEYQSIILSQAKLFLVFHCFIIVCFKKKVTNKDTLTLDKQEGYKFICSIFASQINQVYVTLSNANVLIVRAVNLSFGENFTKFPKF